MIHPVHTSRRKPDGCYEIYYFNKLVGWARESTMKSGHHKIWRALSIHGDLRHTHSLNAARSALLEMHH